MKKYLVILTPTILVPIVINIICLTNVPFAIVDSTNSSSALWLGFFGSYYGGVVTAVVTLYIFYQTLKKDKYQKVYEIANESYINFCRDLSRLVVSLDNEELSYILLALASTEKNELNSFLREIKNINANMKNQFNSFMLIYGDEPSCKKNKFVDEYIKAYNKIDNELTRLFSVISDFNKHEKVNDLDKSKFYGEVADVANKLKDMGDITTTLLKKADEWKYEKHLRLEEIESLYKNSNIW